MFNLNLVFHEIVNNKKDIKNNYAITKKELYKILKLIKSDKKIQQKFIKSIFFDDGYKNILDGDVFLKQFAIKPKIGIVTDFIGKINRLNKSEIKLLNAKGYEICSHSCSHSALSLYGQLSVLKIGTYSNVPIGKNMPLSKNEILFQLKESQKILKNIINKPITKFIYPYGLYNQNIVSIIKESNLYNEAYTCEPQTDDKKDPFACPRFLYTNNYTAESFINFLKEKINSSVVGT